MKGDGTNLKDNLRGLIRISKTNPGIVVKEGGLGDSGDTT